MRTFNIFKTYADEDDPWSGILAATFTIRQTTNRLKGYCPRQLLFGCGMILLIKHEVDWELIRQQNQMWINKYNIFENNKIVDHDYIVGDKVMLNNHSIYIYETPYNGLFFITQCWTNGTITLHCGAIPIWHNIYHIKPHDTNVEYINSKTNDWQRHIRKVLVIYFCIIFKLGTKYIIGCAWMPWN